MGKVYIQQESTKGGKEIICIEDEKQRFVAFINEQTYPGLTNEIVSSFNSAALMINTNKNNLIAV